LLFNHVVTGLVQIHLAHDFSLAVAASVERSRVRGLTRTGKATDGQFGQGENKKFLSIQQLSIRSIANNRAFQ
jgi:hypothetical protein